MPLPMPVSVRTRQARLCAAVLLAGLLLSTAAHAEEAAPATLQPGMSVVMIETKLLFGLASADGSGVSEQ